MLLVQPVSTNTVDAIQNTAANIGSAKRLTYADGPSTQFFCPNKVDAEIAVNAYEKSDDLARQVADQLANINRCRFSDKVRWEKKKKFPAEH